MQPPSNEQNNPYEQQGFTPVPQAYPPAAPDGSYYDTLRPQGPGQGQPQVPVQPQPGAGMPPPYSQPVQGTAPYPPQQGPYIPDMQQGGYPPAQPQDEYAQEAYPAQQPAPFTHQRQPYHAPRAHNYSRINVVLGIIIGVLIIVLGAVAVSQLAGSRQSRTALVSAGTLGSNYAGEAVIVRNEVMYTQEGISQIDYIATEGTQVRRGEKVCTVYTSGFNSKEWTTLNNYRTQIKEYQKVLLNETNIETDSQLKRLNTAVLTRAQETQDMVQRQTGNLINQEGLLATDISERSYYLKQKYADDQKLNRLYDDEKTQLQRIETWTKPFAAGDTGIVSFYTDGFERVLNSLTYEDYSPTQVRQFYQGVLPESAALGRNEVAVYRIVRQSGYTVLMLCDDPTWTPAVGASYELLVESFDNTNVSATVESITRSEGELLVRLSVRGAVEPVLYIRSCHVQLSESIYSLTVPANALTTDAGQIGVVVVQPDGNYFLPVNVISQDAREAHIVPLLNNILSEGSTVLLF